MLTKRTALLAAFCLTALFALWLAIPGEKPLIARKELFGNPKQTEAKVSADGKWIAFLAPDKRDVLNVWVAPIDDLKKATCITHDPKRGVHRYLWHYDSAHILYLQDQDGNENWHLLQTALQAKRTVDLTAFEQVHTDIVAYFPEKPDEMLIQLNQRDPRLFDVYRLNLKSGALTLDTENPGDVHHWVADHALQVRAANVLLPDGSFAVRYRQTASAPWKTALAWGPEEALGGGVIGFTPDDRRLYVLSSIDADTTRLLEVNPVTGSYTVIASDPVYDVDQPVCHPSTHEILAVRVEREKPSWIPVHSSGEALVASLSEQLGCFAIHSASLDGEYWTLSSISDCAAPAYYLFHRDNRKLSFLFRTNPALDHHALASTQPICFSARDGLTLHGYLTLPPEAEKRAHPTVIFVHGGPWSRDTWGFCPQVQWLASRGYAVLQVNFRGSTGYGKAFLAAGDRQWGAKMHEDILDAKEWLQQSGVALSDKIAIFGGSYGGYETLVALSFTPEAFACGVDVVGPSNLVTLLKSLPPYWASSKSLFTQRVGCLDTQEELLMQRSPLHRAECIQRPLLIAQGAKDPRVKQAESDQIVEVLRAKHQPVTYLVFEDEGHGFVRPENRLKFYAEAEQFLAKHLGGSCELAH